MTYSKFPSATLLCSASMLVAASAIAAEPEQDPEHDHVHGSNHMHNEIEEVLVQATPLDRNIVELSQSATVLSGAALQREASNNIGETMTRLPGLSNASFGQNVGRPVIRGMQGQRVGVLANNMASGDASAVSQDHAVSVEPFLADQVEVLRGPATLLYGSGAIGGIVNVVTHTIPQDLPEEPISGRAIALVDSAANQRFAGARLDAGYSQLAFHANAFYRRSDDYEIPGDAELYPDHEETEEHSEGVLENSFLDNQGGSLGASWIGEYWQGGLSWSGYDSDYGIPGGHHEHAHDDEGIDALESEEEDPGVTVSLESSRWDAELLGHDPFAGFEQLKIRFADIDYTHTEFEGDEIGTVFDSSTSDARLELRHHPWGWFRGAFGLQYKSVDFAAAGEEAFVPDSETRNSALFWVESLEFDFWQFDLGFRYEDVDIESHESAPHGHLQAHNTDPRPDSFGFDPLSVSLGAVWHVREGSHLSFSLARAERAPTAQELLAFGPHVANQTFEIGNPNLATENNLHGEIAYRVHGGSLTGSIVLYSDRFDDYIYQENTGNMEDGFPVRQWSQQDAEFSGGEIELRYDAGRHASGHWQIFGFYDFVKAELDDGRDVPLMPPKRIGLGIDWHHESWALAATWIHADDHTRIADYETPTPGYELVNAELSWIVPGIEKSEWELFLKGHNLLDEDIRNSTSHLKDQAPQIGRNFTFGVRALF